MVGITLITSMRRKPKVPIHEDEEVLFAAVVAKAVSRAMLLLAALLRELSTT